MGRRIMVQTKRQRYEFYAETGGEMVYTEAKSDTSKSSEKKKLSHFKTHFILKEYKYYVNRRNILLNLIFKNYY